MNDSILKRKNFIWNCLGLTVNSFTSFFFLIIVNRVNGQNDAGIFTYAYSLICLIYFVGSYFNRTFQVSSNELIYSNKTFLINRIISCAIMVLSTFLLLFVFNYSSYKNIIIIFICVFRMLDAFADVLYGIEQKKGNLYQSGMSMFVKGILDVIIFFFIDLTTKNLIYSCASLVVVNLLGIIIYDFPKTKRFIKNSFNKKEIIEIYKTSFPIFVFSFLNVYLVNSSKYVLDFFCTEEIQNVFGIILMPGTVLSLCCQYILNPYLLELTQLFNDKNYISFNKKIFTICIFIIIIGIVCELGCYLIGIPVLSFLYGFDLSPYKYQLLLILFGAIFLAMISVLSTALTILKKNKIQMYFFIISSVIATIISFVFIKKFNLFGATIAYVLTMVIHFTFYFVYYLRKIKKLEGCDIK